MLGQDVVAVSAKPKLLARETLETPLGLPCAFALKFSAEPKVPVRDFPPSPLAQELAVGCNGGSIQAEVNPDRLSIVNELRRRNGEDNVQMPLAFAASKVGTVKARRLSKEVGRMVVESIGDLLPSRD